MIDFPQDYDYLFKIVLVGDPKVGKSYILSQYIREDFDLENKDTIGVEFDQKFYPTMPGQDKILVQLWDSAGKYGFLQKLPSYFRASTGALLIFDVTKKDSFLNCEKWYNTITSLADPHIQIVLVGNKTDLSNLRIVSRQEAEDFAKQRNIKYIEVSALTGNNIDEAVGIVVEDTMRLIRSNSYNVSTNKNILLKHRVDVSQRNQCCGTGGMV
ncbi:Rab-family small GTPase (macronuclear) [Tetrahymena thermophila SB210]|uniref:Rab-family small GTPase n=2 Tax=Tetrahymena thermophila TaxID=5911 RepID=Q247S3_TETTS|nr:Rab-family small GTPase [Tetrahymena thermophila SB210]EAS04027.1 Rab-family small GTPase [Tetrahymena thermophila SB210]BAJ21308.1 Rab-family small GTPase RabX13 [Tetrahymena thermophila]|eukprot:XP_001024272.1 Rab-family small GTPase [Tetrahymena thermophila SB210]